MLFIGLKTCDTCRKALKSLRESGADPRVHDVRADGLDPDLIAQILAVFGDKAVNKSSATWRNLSENDRALGAAALLSAHPTLLKRPVIRRGDVWFQGWKPDVQKELLG